MNWLMGLANSQGVKFKDWVTIATASGDRTLSQNEIYATHIENNFRGEQGKPLRTQYSQDADGYSINETRILDRRTGLYSTIQEIPIRVIIVTQKLFLKQSIYIQNP